MNCATRSAESPSSLGASRAICSVSRLTLTAPAFDFELVEDLSDDAAQEAFQAGIVDIRQGSNRLLFVRVEEAPATPVGAQLTNGAEDLFLIGRRQRTRPRFAQRGADLLLGVRPLEGDGERQCRTHATVLARAITGRILDVISNL